MRYTGPSAAVKAIVKARLDGMCLRCRALLGSEIHHRVSRGAGGSRPAWINEPPNLTYLCHHCHRDVTEHPIPAYVAGWLVRRNGPDLPESIPLTDLAGRVFLLADDGGLIPTTLGGLLPEHPELEKEPF